MHFLHCEIFDFNLEYQWKVQQWQLQPTQDDCAVRVQWLSSVIICGTCIYTVAWLANKDFKNCVIFGQRNCNKWWRIYHQSALMLHCALVMRKFSFNDNSMVLWKHLEMNLKIYNAKEMYFYNILKTGFGSTRGSTMHGVYKAILLAKFYGTARVKLVLQRFLPVSKHAYCKWWSQPMHDPNILRSQLLSDPVATVNGSSHNFWRITSDSLLYYSYTLGRRRFTADFQNKTAFTNVKIQHLDIDNVVLSLDDHHFIFKSAVLAIKLWPCGHFWPPGH